MLYGFDNEVLFQLSRLHGDRYELTARLTLLKLFPEVERWRFTYSRAAAPPPPERRLRLGYVSSNFLNHAQGTLDPVAG
jgi:predicted O-linked N-acetylglucosamine transferase (SPINDLY family)